ncbi:hypothetical protein BDZ97DRAFT_1793052 [Flammula alnicola]|nr:hypothetical protein BDZ97DRAFT_1793052 [Flammula alnicola]
MTRTSSPHSVADVRALDEIPEQSPNDILQRGVDHERCVAGRFKMAWPLTGKKIETIANISSSSTLEHKQCSFRIFFELSDKYLQMLDLSPHDEFRLSLRGAEVQKLSQIPKLSSLPMQLVFSKGVHIQWKHQGPGMERKMLSTWLLSEPANTQSDSWFLSQGEKDANPPVQTKRKHDESEELHQNQPQQDPSLSKQLRKRQRMDAKRQRQEANTRHIDESADSSLLNMDIVKNCAPNIMTSQGTKAQPLTSPMTLYASPTSVHASNSRSEAVTVSKARKSEASSSNRIPELKAGFRTGSDTYIALNDIRPGRSALLIGIVTNMSTPSTTRKGDWMRFINIVDPSNYHPHGSGLKINCFTKRHKEWLPHPEEGDVLILRQVKIGEYQGNLTGTGYSDKLRWAAFSSTKGEIHHGPPNKAPKQEGLAEGGFGVAFSPFFQPGPPEVTYCVKLSDWWRDVNTQNPLEAAAAQNQEERLKSPQSTYLRSAQRVHRLISETGPSVPPSGYFDCTIEVLNGFRNNNSNMVYTLYVTDYTRNDQMTAVQANWCPASLSELVLQLEMWDTAAEIAQNMRPGQFYFIKNARMKHNSSGYLEGKVAQDKIARLAEDDTTNVHLKALLERKRKWQARQASAESEITYQLIQDIEEGKFFNCTVELLHAVPSTDQRACIYVTDYTSHPRLTAVSEAWSQGHDGRTVKIMLSEEQQYIANCAITGSFYCIRKLRLRYSSVEECFCGLLGGNEKLVVPLNPNKTDNEHLNGLLRRKENWEKTMKRHPPGAAGAKHMAPAIPPENNAPTVILNHPFTRIKDIALEDLSPAQYQLVARAVDFHPLELQDAFYQQCSRCNTEIPKIQRACTKCGDFEHEYVQYLYQLYLMLEDEDENQIVVSVDNKCPLLNGLKRACIREDQAALQRFRERVEPMLGNLVMMHNGLKAGKGIEIDTPLLCFEVGSWLVPDGKRAFRLSKYNT